MLFPSLIAGSIVIDTVSEEFENKTFDTLAAAPVSLAQVIMSKMSAAVIGAVVIPLTLFYVRNWFGLLFGVAFGVALILASRQLPRSGNAALLTALGLTSCLYAILDIKSDVLDRPNVMSDARMLADLTGVPTLVWGLLWIAVALVFSTWLFKLGYRSASRKGVGEGEILQA